MRIRTKVEPSSFARSPAARSEAESAALAKAGNETSPSAMAAKHEILRCRFIANWTSWVLKPFIRAKRDWAQCASYAMRGRVRSGLRQKRQCRRPWPTDLIAGRAPGIHAQPAQFSVTEHRAHPARR